MLYFFLLNISITSYGDADACFNITINGKYINLLLMSCSMVNFCSHEFVFVCVCAAGIVTNLLFLCCNKNLR